jgi:hypothetical protein
MRFRLRWSGEGMTPTGNITLSRIAGVLAFIIGAMALVAGGGVLLGRDPGYYVIGWLPIYNFAMGAISAFFAAPVIWKNSRLSMPTAVGILGLHAVVMLILQAAYRAVVAADSVMAMTVRLVFWVVIVGLLIVQQRQQGNSQRPSR